MNDEMNTGADCSAGVLYLGGSYFLPTSHIIIMVIYMNDFSDKQKHTVLMENRESVEMTGIIDVDSFNEEEINARSDWGSLMIKGEGLSVESLDVANGNLKVAGNITALIYTELSTAKSFFSKLFSND